MTELLSCPCCAGDLTLHDTDWCEPIEYFARCDACGLHFPGSIDRQAAITIANRRPARDARAAVIKGSLRQKAEQLMDLASKIERASSEDEENRLCDERDRILADFRNADRALANRSALPSDG